MVPCAHITHGTKSVKVQIGISVTELAAGMIKEDNFSSKVRLIFRGFLFISIIIFIIFIPVYQNGFVTEKCP